MEIKRIYSNMKDQPDTKPYPDANGICIRWYEGDVVYPMGKGKNADGSSRWFTAPYFNYVIKFKLKWWMTVLAFLATLFATFSVSLWFALLLLFIPGPFISYRYNNRFGYWGSKPFGVDNEPYGHWMCDPKEVYSGSLAIMLSSIRPFATGK